MKILVIEDEELLREEIVGRIRKALPEHEVHEAARLAEAVWLAGSVRPGLCITDLNLKDSWGDQTVPTLNAVLPAECEVFVCTAFDFAGKLPGIKQFFDKPPDFAAMLDAIKDSAARYAAWERQHEGEP